MVEFADINRIFGMHDGEREKIRVSFINHFGHMEANAQAQLMRIMRDAFKDKEMTVPQVYEQLADGMLMVGGNNAIAHHQFAVAVDAYSYDRLAWDHVISQYEKEQKGEK